MSRGLLVAAPDKFRGSLSAAEVAAAMGAGAFAAGWDVRLLPLADGGEGTLEVLGGANRRSSVTGPLGTPVEAAWRLEGERAVIEAAAAAGLALAGGREANDALGATTAGVGELIGLAAAAGAREVLVGVGGSASTDGGLGALRALGERPFCELGVTVRVACDVTTRFLDAARLFGPQKGAGPEEVEILTRRLAEAAEHYRARLGVEVAGLCGSGAAGGLAGGLAALGAHLESGFELVASVAGLDDALGEAAGEADRDGVVGGGGDRGRGAAGDADHGGASRPPSEARRGGRLGAVATGEGLLDATSTEGKVVAGVAARARHFGLPVLAVVGHCTLDPSERPPGTEVVSLTDAFGSARSWAEPAALVAEATTSWLQRLPPR